MKTTNRTMNDNRRVNRPITSAVNAIASPSWNHRGSKVSHPHPHPHPSPFFLPDALDTPSSSLFPTTLASSCAIECTLVSIPCSFPGHHVAHIPNINTGNCSHTPPTSPSHSYQEPTHQSIALIVLGFLTHPLLPLIPFPSLDMDMCFRIDKRGPIDSIAV